MVAISAKLGFFFFFFFFLCFFFLYFFGKVGEKQTKNKIEIIW